MNNQVAVLLPWWPKAGIDWFILGGADHTGAEAVHLHKKFPRIKMLGIEPNPEFVKKIVEEIGFPGTVVEAALWDRDGETLTLSKPNHLGPSCYSVCRPKDAPDGEGNPNINTLCKVSTITLDTLDEQHGPFTNAALWLDIEYAEVKALLGAKKLLASGRVKLLNIETFLQHQLKDVLDILYPLGYRLRRVWNWGKNVERDGQDYIFALEE